MRHSVLLLISGAAALFGGAHCSSSSSPASGIPKDSFVDTYVHAACDVVAPCCDGAFDASLCLSRSAGLQLDLNTRLLPGYTYDADRALACVNELKASVAKCEGAALLSQDTIVCDGIVRGPKKLGEACTKTDDCGASGSAHVECIPALGDSSKSICASVKSPSEGDACTKNVEASDGVTEVSGCADATSTYYCEAATSTCALRGGAGTACISAGASGALDVRPACDDTSHCDATKGACATRTKIGAPCSTSTECDLAAYCDTGKSNKCVQKKNAGEICASNDECEFECNGTTKKCASSELSKLCVRWTK